VIATFPFCKEFEKQKENYKNKNLIAQTVLYAKLWGAQNSEPVGNPGCPALEV